MKPNIDNYNDIMDFLDNQIQYVSWDEFYKSRNQPAPFIIQNELPDENLVEIINRGYSITSVIELGCGEGRNAIYMAKRGLTVTAIDISPIAIKSAKIFAEQKGLDIDFCCQDIFHTRIDCRYDFVYDSGLFHHLAPHRRISYIDLLRSILKPNGYFGLVCFSWGYSVGEEVNDWEFYKKGAPGCLCSRTMTAQDSRIMTAKISQIIDQPRIKARAKKKPHCLHAMGDMA